MRCSVAHGDLLPRDGGLRLRLIRPTTLAYYDSRLRRLPHRVVDQRLAERPDRAGHVVAAGDDGIERGFDPFAVFVGDRERRQELDGMAAVAGDLGQDL